MDGCRRALIGCLLVAGMLFGGAASAYAQNANPTVTASRTPTTGVRIGVPVQFTAVGADADNDALTYAWTFGDNTTSTEQNPTKAYAAAGTYTATVTVSDGKGGTATASITGLSVQANRNPSITVATATAGLAPFTSQLAATATDDPGNTVSYAWDLDGDGTFETTERNPSLNVTAVGDKVVTLRVTDQFGGVATRAVTINALSPTTDPAKKYNVLVFSKTAGFRHGSIGPGITAIKLLGQQNNFGVDAIEDAALFTDAFLARYDAVIWLSTTGDVLNDAQQAAFERYIKGGGGYVGIHAASDTEYTWPWYGQLVGGYFRNHPAGTPTATVVTEDAAHASTAHLPARWTRVDEWYNFQGITNPMVGGGGTDVSPRGLTPIHVLLTVDESTYNEDDGTTTTDDDHPVSWCKRFDGGRMFYTAMGHTNQSFTEAPFLQHLVNGIDIAAGYASDLSCGIFRANTSGDVTGTVPATLSLSLGTPTPLGPFTPGVSRTYTSTATATVTSTAGDGALSVSDPSPTATGRLVNGTFSLPRPLDVMASSAGGTASAFAPLSTTGAPVNVLTYTGPVTADAVTVSMRQVIEANDALRTGTYAKTLTFTLSTTQP